MLRLVGELADAVLEEMARPPLVTFEDGYFVFTDRDIPGFRYDFLVRDMADAMNWVRHMAEKQWVTTDHLAVFADLALREFGGRHA